MTEPTHKKLTDVELDTLRHVIGSSKTESLIDTAFEYIKMLRARVAALEVVLMEAKALAPHPHTSLMDDLVASQAENDRLQAKVAELAAVNKKLIKLAFTNQGG